MAFDLAPTTWEAQASSEQAHAPSRIHSTPTKQSIAGDFDDNWMIARSLLAQHRTSQPAYRQPSHQIRHIFRTKAQKEAVCNESRWTFTTQEVAYVFHNTLSSNPLPAVGIAEALLKHASPASLAELWRLVHQGNPATASQNNIHSAMASSVSLSSEMTWLDGVTAKNNLEYVSMLCQAGVELPILTQALILAISKHWIEGARVLLAYGADPSHCKAAIRERMISNDVPLVRLLLSAPKQMDIQAWKYCLGPLIELRAEYGSHKIDVLQICISKQPELASADLLLKSLRSQNVRAAAIILSIDAENIIRGVRDEAYKLLTLMHDDYTLYEWFTLFAGYGLLSDHLIIQKLLLDYVKARSLSLIQILVNVGITLDVEPNNTVAWAVSKMDLEVLELLGEGKMSSRPSSLLDLVPALTPESDMLRLIDILGPRGISGRPLNAHLVRAVRNMHIKLAEKMVLLGASVEFQQAAAIKSALENADSQMLQVLLRGECSPEILALAFPTALSVQPRPLQSQILSIIVRKGLPKRSLGYLLQKMVSERHELDNELIALLLRHHAPVEYGGDNNPLLVAVRARNMSVLTMLCETSPGSDLLSRAVLVAFQGLEDSEYQTIRDMIRLLLEKGATGDPVDQTLLEAATKDDHLDIVRLLLTYGADANFASGAAFQVAIATSNHQLLTILCLECRPDAQSTFSILPMATDPRYYNLHILNMILETSTASIATLESMWNSTNYSGNPNMQDILLCFMSHGLSVDIFNGSVLRFLVEESYTDTLRHILEMNSPLISSLENAFQAAVNVSKRQQQLEIMTILLNKAESKEIGQSKRLAKEVEYASDGDLEGLELLLRHRPDVNCQKGEAIWRSAVRGSHEVLNLLLSLNPSQTTLSRICIAASGLLPLNVTQELRSQMLENLLDANGGMSKEGMLNLLFESVETLPENSELPLLLIARGTNITTEVLEKAMNTASPHTFVAIFDHVENKNSAMSVFGTAIRNSINVERKIPIVKHLLSKDIPRELISDALVDALKCGDLVDLSLPKLLLEHQADVGHKTCQAFSLAIENGSATLVRLLTQYIKNGSVAVHVFDMMLKVDSLAPKAQLEIYSALLQQWPMKMAPLQEALLKSLRAQQRDIRIVRLLLDNGAEPNFRRGVCFTMAAQNGDAIAFRTLCSRSNLSIAIPAILRHSAYEAEVLKWLRISFEEMSAVETTDHDVLLVECIKKFPGSAKIVKLLLTNGITASTMIYHRFRPNWKSEKCSLLTYALFSSQRIENVVLLELCARGNEALTRIKVLPTHTTSHTNLSAAFGCLFDQDRAPVLKALLKLDRKGVLSHTLRGSTFKDLTIDPGKHPDGSNDFIADDREISIHDAALFLGNFEAYRLVATPEPNDGTLHLAAYLALPQFVKWLLRKHDPNYRSEQYDHMIPLAVACNSQPLQCCKIANENENWTKRLGETMKLLAKQTDRKWRHRQRTVLHIALNTGPEVTKVLIDALDIRHDLKKDDNYLYVDRTGIRYSPSEYVDKIVEAGAAEKRELNRCLQRAGFN